MKNIARLVLLFSLVVIALGGCKGKDKIEKVGNVEYTVIDNDSVPAEFAKEIELKKEKGFKLTYTDEQYLYIGVGYGEEKTGGYSIAVKDLYLGDNCVVFDSNLIGPSQEDAAKEAITYPYIVVKIEKIDKPVVFK